ncbi:uncharacterized protein SOCG_04638 [Schizosaccharomyces octosporus yFS286]|uniref:Uncharacterized protein n=1 Tax=Schizosaccharomyces octosporus (strain yFS286) TaxID=483514 RepID=S9Q280_SCHOY|nr:uncharacterized protein SOCG_04638 [Schizosaccharomyces octosporus yFS286]EPX75396.1 hypothetical protein SOCG_04638 [Schizosaccharomyces octosporus yFS286]
MKNKYTPVSDSEESSKTLTDEKADTRSSEGTPPPSSNKFIDLEMADGSAQNSAELSENNIRSDPSPNKQWWKTPVIGTVTIITIIYNIVFIAIVLVTTFLCIRTLFMVLLAALLDLFVLLSLQFFISVRNGTGKLEEQQRSALRNSHQLLNGVGAMVLVVLAVLNICLFVLLIRNPIGFGNMTIIVPTNNRISRNRPPRNEETELQPLADQSSEV